MQALCLVKTRAKAPTLRNIFKFAVQLEINDTWKTVLCIKSVLIRSYSGPHFPAFRPE